MPSSQFFVDLHEYINRDTQPVPGIYAYFHYGSAWFYGFLARDESGGVSMDHIREFWGRTPSDVKEFLLMEMDIVRYMAEDDEPLSVTEFAQYWRSLDDATRLYYRRNFPRHNSLKENSDV